ncbi:MAG: SpoIIE family protein phosphatase [Thermoanaerobaculia bacterium]|nr:SpoIIE family protein phosphatase [Thermoanaerobaculia bacterium]
MTQTEQRYEITILNPLFPPERKEIDPHRPTTIGRSIECVVPIKDRYLSRHHADLIPEESGKRWTLRDCGSANGTYVNGVRITDRRAILPGDRIRLGDTEIVFHVDTPTDKFFAVADEAPSSATIAIPVDEIQTGEQEMPPELSRKSIERLATLNILASELIEDQPPDRLFGYILDRIMQHLGPSRAAIALVGEGMDAFTYVEVRRRDPSDSTDLKISRTLLDQLIEEKQALSFLDVAGDEKLSQAKSIVDQEIHSVLCAPMIIGGSVVGLLYVDYQFTNESISEQEVRLVAQIAQFAAMKLETTRLREDALQKRLMEEELKTAYTVQKGLLPQDAPVVPGYTFHGVHRPCRTVSGDYYDFVVRPGGAVYFAIADVSGKGITAALLMAGLQAAFRIYAKEDPSPADLISRLNVAMKESLPPSRFITIFVGRLEPETGKIIYANAGHTPPIHYSGEASDEKGDTDLLLAMFSRADYRNQEMSLAAGDSLVLFTDGVTEAENPKGEELGTSRFLGLRSSIRGRKAEDVAKTIEGVILDFIGDGSLQDDITMVVISRESVDRPG